MVLSLLLAIEHLVQIRDPDNDERTKRR